MDIDNSNTMDNDSNSNNLLPKHYANEWLIDYSNPLGNGRYSDGIFKAKKLNSVIGDRILLHQGECVVKIIGRKHIDKIGFKEIETIDRLVKLQSNGETSNGIVQYYGYGFDDDGICYIYMEYLDGFKSLTDMINSRLDKRMDEIEMKIIYFTLIKALQFLHKFNIIHRDLKCDNILFNEQSKEVKMIDFGVSKYLETKSKPFTGTLTHMSPETRLGRSYGKSDMWSLGCTMLEMAGGDLSNLTEDGITPVLPSFLNLELVSKIRILLNKEVYYRPSTSTSNLEEYGIYAKKLNKFNLATLDFNILPKTNLNITANNTTFISAHVINFNYQIHSLSILPPSITVLSIDRVIPASLIPPSVKHLILTTFNEPITPNIVPPTVSVLTLSEFNQPIKPNSIPTTLISLHIPSFNGAFDTNAIPETLLSLILGDSYQFNEYSRTLPTSLRVLVCGYKFKSPLNVNNNIPQNIGVLHLINYNQPIVQGSIPKVVRSLALGSSYTHFESLANLPSSIVSLKFCVDNLDIKTKESIIKLTPKTIMELHVNNIKLI